MSAELCGIVVTFDPAKGFGFIRSPSCSDDVFVHVSVIVGGESLRPGQRVYFEAIDADRGPRATRVLPGKPGMTPALTSAMFLSGFLLLTTTGLGLLGIPWIGAWITAINLGTLAVWALDKRWAIRKARRVPEFALLALVAMGGMLGALIGILAIGHKRRKVRFLIMFGGIVVLQVTIIAVLALRN